MEKAYYINVGKVATAVPPTLSHVESTGSSTRASRASNWNVPDYTIPRWKRCFDLTLIVLTAPIWIILMSIAIVMIRCVSSGPVIFRQRRIGQGGQEFTLFKFRSMYVDSEVRGHEDYVRSLIESNQPMTKLDKKDSRVIPGGKWLRALALDELPQIFNVWRGEMSLVGPRPGTVQEYSCYRPWHKGRVAAAPGLTGLWQVGGKNKLSFDEMVELDLRYCETMCLQQDALIVLRTVPALIGQLLSR